MVITDTRRSRIRKGSLNWGMIQSSNLEKRCFSHAECLLCAACSVGHHFSLCLNVGIVHFCKQQHVNFICFVHAISTLLQCAVQVHLTEVADRRETAVRDREWKKKRCFFKERSGQFPAKREIFLIRQLVNNLCLNLTRPSAQHCHNIKLKTDHKETWSLDLSVVCRNVAMIHSGDWGLLQFVHHALNFFILKLISSLFSNTWLH